MQPKAWRRKLSETVREIFVSPELTKFFATPATPERSRLYLSQLSINVRNRRHYWPKIAGNCPNQMPNFTAQGAADEKHSGMFLDNFERYAAESGIAGVVPAARESMQFHRAFFGGIAEEMNRL